MCLQVMRVRVLMMIALIMMVIKTIIVIVIVIVNVINKEQFDLVLIRNNTASHDMIVYQIVVGDVCNNTVQQNK